MKGDRYCKKIINNIQTTDLFGKEAKHRLQIEHNMEIMEMCEIK